MSVGIARRRHRTFTSIAVLVWIQYTITIPSPNRKMPRFVGWVEARNPTNTLGFASLKRQVLQLPEPPEVLMPSAGYANGGSLRSDNSGQRTGSPTYKKMAKVLNKAQHCCALTNALYSMQLRTVISDRFNFKP